MITSYNYSPTLIQFDAEHNYRMLVSVIGMVHLTDTFRKLHTQEENTFRKLHTREENTYT